MDRLTIFWIIHLAFLGLFGLEMLFLAWVWLGARAPGLPRDASRGYKLRVVAGRARRGVLSRRSGVFLKTLILDGLIHRRLFHTDKLRWLAHSAVFWGLALMGGLSIVTGIAAEFLNPHPDPRLSPIVYPSHHPIVEILVDMDHPITAALNEGLGLLVLAGLALAAWRRYVRRDTQLRTQGPDTALLALLAVIAGGGYVVEALRFLAEGTPAGQAMFAPLGYGLALLLGLLPLSREAWAGVHFWAFFAHFATVSLLLFAMPFTKFFHALISPLVAALNAVDESDSLAKVANLRKAPMSTRLDIAHLTGRQVLELLACTRCGECIPWCPTYAEAERDEITPLDKISTLRSFLLGQTLGAGSLGRLLGHRRPDDAGLERWAAGAYDCTLCGRCRVVCPVGIRTRELWIAMREQLVALNRHPALMDRLRETVAAQYNIVGQPNEQRTGWSDNLERVPPSLDRQKGAEVVYFLGCVAAFYPTVYSIPRAMVQVMDYAGVSWTTLGDAEWCCGFPLTIAGMGADAEALARHNVAAVRDLGARAVVTACPSCYHTWQHEYPRIVGDLGVRVMHSTGFLRDLVRAGRVELRGFPAPITYHDPCDLGRTNGIYDAPREIFRAIPGVQFTEMRDHREYSLCCGGGGDVEMADAELSQAVARRRLLQAQETGAQTIVTACQQCQRTLLGAARREKARIRTIDVSELVLESIRQT